MLRQKEADPAGTAAAGCTPVLHGAQRDACLLCKCSLRQACAVPIESAQLEQLISTGFTTVSALVNWWFNNSFTKDAIQADAEFERLRKSVK